MAAKTEGVITLINGYRRHAVKTVGELTGRELIQYRTPAGNWRNPLPREAATFTPATPTA